MSVPDLTKLTPPEIDELWAEALEPWHKAVAALNETRRSLRRYEKHGRTPDFLVEREAKQEAAAAEAKLASAPFDAEFKRRGGWTRYYLCVSSSNGHVHRSSCSTLTPGRTLVTPVYELSGADDERVVGRLTHTACTVCFPEAPVARQPTPEEQDLCPGSGTYDTDPERGRPWAAYSPSSGCKACGQIVTITSTGKLRKHKAEGKS